MLACKLEAVCVRLSSSPESPTLMLKYAETYGSCTSGAKTNELDKSRVKLHKTINASDELLSVVCVVVLLSNLVKMVVVRPRARL